MKYKKMKVKFDEEKYIYNCFIDENNKYWNGWLNPYFDKKTKNLLIDNQIKLLENKVFDKNKNTCLNFTLLSELMDQEFNYKLGFKEMETFELLKFFFDFVNGKTEYIFNGLQKDILNEIVDNIIGYENYNFINELYQVEKEKHNKKELYYFGSCYCWIPVK